MRCLRCCIARSGGWNPAFTQGQSDSYFAYFQPIGRFKLAQRLALNAASLAQTSEFQTWLQNLGAQGSIDLSTNNLQGNVDLCGRELQCPL